MEITQTNSEITQQDDPLSMAVKTAFNSIKELQELATPEAVYVESVVAEPLVERSITDISNAHVALNLPADEADLPVQSAHVHQCPSVPNLPPIEVEVASEQVETQVESQLNAKENHDDAQRATFTQECSSQPLMSQDVYQITPQLYEGTILLQTISVFISVDSNFIIINNAFLCSDIMHGISLMTVKEIEGVVEVLAQTNKYKKQTRLKKVLKNVSEITAGGDYRFHH